MIGLAAIWGASLCAVIGFSLAYMAGKAKALNARPGTPGLYIILGWLYFAVAAWVLAAPGPWSVSTSGLVQGLLCAAWVLPLRGPGTVGQVLAILCAVGGLLSSFAVYHSL